MSRGRLLKKKDHDKISILNVEEYPWTDFSVEKILLPDNPRKSVVLAKSHSPQELRKKVVQPQDFEKPLREATTPIRPVDLSKDYELSQHDLRQRKKRQQLNEDEAVAFELIGLDLPELKRFSTASSYEQDEQDEQEDSYRRIAKSDAAATGVKTNIKGQSPDISDLSKLAAQSSRGIEEGALDFAATAQDSQDFEEKLKEAYEQGLETGRAEGEKTAAAAAAAALARVEEERKKLEQAAKEVLPTYEEGLEKGVAQGREEVLKEAEERFNSSVVLFTKALSELQHLKGELLSTGREIFAEIAQICAEKVLRNSVRLNDNALRSVFESATAQFLAQDELKIEMHPEDLARLETQISAEQRQRIKLVPNTKLERGDLKIEANNEVVSLDLHGTVQQVLDSLKDDIFEESGSSDSTDKAG
jgi:flagellar biosynthesis/type III secretory pathway protein FliH